jgi:hypothetical protein
MFGKHFTQALEHNREFRIRGGGGADKISLVGKGFDQTFYFNWNFGKTAKLNLKITTSFHENKKGVKKQHARNWSAMVVRVD